MFVFLYEEYYEKTRSVKLENLNKFCYDFREKIHKTQISHKKKKYVENM